MDCGTVPLSELRPGMGAAVDRVTAAGRTGQRLLDLGMIPGAVIRCLFTAPSGSPAAYEVFGAVVALRRGDAERVWVRLWD